LDDKEKTEVQEEVINNVNAKLEKFLFVPDFLTCPLGLVIFIDP
jgi:hypothetical protein